MYNQSINSTDMYTYPYYDINDDNIVYKELDKTIINSRLYYKNGILMFENQETGELENCEIVK